MISAFTTPIFIQNNTVNEWANFVGHFHPLLVHLPIGILFIGFILLYIDQKTANSTLSKAINITFFWGAVSAVLSCVAGYYLKETGGYDETTLYWHQNFGIGVAAISTLIYVVKKMSTVTWLSFFNKLLMPIAAILTILIIITGHLGGNMTHGSDFLTAAMPQPYKGWLGIESKQEAKKQQKIIDPAMAIAYTDVIQPILENKCYKCHSSEKQKGDLRMDTKDFLQKGGKNGPIFLAGNATSSEMIKRALLPENDDDHMPPKGKPQLTENEIALLHWWIQNGANFDKKVIEIQQDDKVKPILASLLAGAAGAVLANKTEPESAVYSMKVSAAKEADINKLKEKNILVMPLAKDLNLLEVSCVNTKDFNDEQAKLLPTLANQIVWLKLSNTKITDTATTEIGKLPNLVKLFLTNTAITDAGLDKLSGLKNLEYINLVNTKITDAGLAKLAKIKSLRKIFLWQTLVSKPAFEAFKKANPTILADMGWEGKALLSDTTKVKASDLKGAEDN